MGRLTEQLEACLQVIRERGAPAPELGLVLGSGLGFLAESVEAPVSLPYAALPGFPVSTVPGHEGRLVLGRLAGRSVAVMQGRFHFYEGYPMERVVMGVRLLGRLGVRALVLTNAAGGIRPGFTPGDLMLIEDHINLMGQNPLLGPNDLDLGPRFPDMSDAYSRHLREQARKIAAEFQIALHEGTYAALLGPSYETPAEIRVLRALGADAVGMSTVPEVIAAVHMGVRVLGLSCISNLAAGLSSGPLSHAEVTETAQRVRGLFSRLVLALVERLELGPEAN